MLPTALPIAKEGSPSKQLYNVTKNSGNVVARLTIVAPITISGIPVARLIFIELSTKIFPPYIISNSPIARTNTVTAIKVVYRFKINMARFKYAAKSNQSR